MRITFIFGGIGIKKESKNEEKVFQELKRGNDKRTLKATKNQSKPRLQDAMDTNKNKTQTNKRSTTQTLSLKPPPKNQSHHSIISFHKTRFNVY